MDIIGLKNFISRQFSGTETGIKASYNTDGWGNKLVTIFARHLDNLIVTPNISLIYLIRDFGSGYPDNYRDAIVSADGATNVYSLNRRAVMVNSLQLCALDNSLRTNHNRISKFLNFDNYYLAIEICM